MKITLAKRLLATVLALALSVGLLSTGAVAATFGSVQEIKPAGGSSTDGEIVVTVYDQTPGSVGDGDQNSSGLSNPVKDVGINALRIGSVVELTTTNGTTVSTQVAFGLTKTYADLLGLDTGNAIASQTDSSGSTTTYYFTPSSVQDALSTKNQAAGGQAAIESHLNNASPDEVKKDVTDSNGVATFENLPYGLYLLAKSSLPAAATTDLVPFLVSVPMDVNGTWTSTVYAYPKVRTGNITISKTVDDQDGSAYSDGDIYVNAGQTLKYTVTTEIPASQSATGTGSANQFTSFVITDTNTDSTLDIKKDSVKVKLGNTLLKITEDYTLDYPDPIEGGNSVLTITLTNTPTTGGLAKLNAGLSNAQTITVTYDATVATDVNFSSALTNTATATYQRQGMTVDGSATVAEGETNTVTLYTYGIDLTKTLSDGNNIDANTISFELYKTYSGGSLSDKVPVQNGTTGYWQAAASATEPNTNTYTMKVDARGSLKLYGLEPDTYYLKETATMPGYTLLAEPITIVIDATNQPDTAPTVNGATAQVTGGVVHLTVENTKNDAGFTLPQTGGTGTLMATAIGLGLLCIGVILLVVYRRKGQKNS